MKIKRIFIVIIIVVICFSCSADEDDEMAAAACIVPPVLTVRNSSEYIIKSLILHDSEDYQNIDPVITNMQSGQEELINVSSGDNKYFTFIRNITSTSSQEIAVTTGNSIEFEGCKTYKLYLLEEDFLLQ